jgi:hypothetical protein
MISRAGAALAIKQLRLFVRDRLRPEGERHNRP